MSKLLKESRSIIINADDFGYDENTALATIACFAADSLTSATIMPNMPATEMALKFARDNPEHSYGVHLTFVSDTVERPVANPALIPMLVQENGLFRPSNQVRLMALLGVLPVDQIRIETIAQIERILDSGVTISHIDSHGHLHKFKPFVQTLAEILPRYGLSRVRNVQNQYTTLPLISPTFWFGSFWRRRIMTNFCTTPHFFMGAGSGDLSWVTTILDREICGPLEVGVHPGHPTHPENWRNFEREACLLLATEARKRGISLIGWKDV